MTSDLDEQLERAQADGRISTHDADEVRRFGDFLSAVAEAPRGAARVRIFLEHYPEHRTGKVTTVDPWGLAASA